MFNLPVCFKRIFCLTLLLLFINEILEAQDTTIIRGFRLSQHTLTNHNNFTIKQFNGKWQEVERHSRKDDSLLSFKDTMFLTFNGDNVITRDGVNYTLQGKANLQPGNVLEAAADVFVIKSLDETFALLDDREKYVRKFMKKENFFHEKYPTDTVTEEKFITPVKTSFNNIKGRWQVYRRDAKPGSVFSNQQLITFINISDFVDDVTFNGSVNSFHSQITSSENCVITLDAETLYIVTENHAWHVDVYKADGKDLVFGDPSLIYYCKPAAQD